MFNLQLLSNGELSRLFLSESKLFAEGVDKGLTFPEMKQIKVNLRNIAFEQQNRLRQQG